MASLLENIELVIWSPRSSVDPPTVEQMCSALIAQDFSGRLAEDVPITTAFRRTVKSREGVNADTKEEIRATVWQNGRLRGQLDKLTTDPDTHRIKREFVAGWQLLANDAPYCDPPDLTEHVERAVKQYTFADVSGIIQEILKTCGMGAYSLRRSGGVYVVPTNGRDMLDRLGRMCEAVGLNLLRYDIPDNRAQRDEIQGAIADSLLADIGQHLEAMNGYNHESTKLGIVDNRIEAIRASTALAQKLTPHLGERASPIMTQLGAILAQCTEIRNTVAAYKPVSAGRRIVTHS